MKKFGTPTLAAPGSASEYVGSSSAGGWTLTSGVGVAVGASGTVPVSDSVLAAPETWFAGPFSTVSCVRCLVFSTFSRALPVPPSWRAGV